MYTSFHLMALQSSLQKIIKFLSRIESISFVVVIKQYH